MKTGAIVRLIIWILVALVLCGLMAGIMIFKNIDFSGWDGFAFGFVGDSYPESSSYTVGAGNISQTITAVDIEWRAGSVTVEAYDGHTVQIEETAVNNQDDQLRYRVTDGKLTIHYRKSGRFFGFGQTPVKDLTLRIPREMAQNLSHVQIQTASAAQSISGIHVGTLIIDNLSDTVNITDVTAQKCAISNVSGRITLINVVMPELDAETVSGELALSGEFGAVETNSVSGDVMIHSTVPMRELDAESVSGNVTLTIPNDGFRVDFDTASGRFTSPFSLRTDGDEQIYGNGGAEFTVDTTSGDFAIQQG